MSTTMPASALRRALVAEAPPVPAAMLTDHDLDRVLVAIQEAGFLIVSRRDMHDLRAASDRVLRYVPEPDPTLVWCNVSGCPLHGVREHGHAGGSPTPTRPR